MERDKQLGLILFTVCAALFVLNAWLLVFGEMWLKVLITVIITFMLIFLILGVGMWTGLRLLIEPRKKAYEYEYNRDNRLKK